MEFNGTFLVAFISFIAFTIIMNWILYEPISNIVAKRKGIVDANYEEADKNSKKSAAILQDKNERLAKATDDARNIVAQKTNEINNQKNEITSKAKAEAKKNIDDYNAYYENATAEAKEFLRNEVVNLAQIISDKFFEQTEMIDTEENKELLDSITQG